MPGGRKREESCLLPPDANGENKSLNDSSVEVSFGIASFVNVKDEAVIRPSWNSETEECADPEFPDDESRLEIECKLVVGVSNASSSLPEADAAEEVKSKVKSEPLEGKEPAVLTVSPLDASAAENNFLEISKTLNDPDIAISCSYECKTCGKSFVFLKNLNRHILSHSGQDDFKCGKCGKCFVDIKRKALHTQICPGKKLFECNVLVAKEVTGQCDMSGDSPVTDCGMTEKLGKHVERVKCGKQFSCLHNLNRHRSLVHSTEKPFACQECDRGFCDSSSLRRHSRVHTSERPYRCDQCDRCFYSCLELNCHKQAHTGVKPFQCTQCSKRFCRKKTLKYHMTLHSGSKQYKCKNCGQSFCYPSTLQRHLVVAHHRVENKTHKCDECDKCFASLTSLKIHVRVHTIERPYKCNQCKSSFFNLASLNDHTKKHSDCRSKLYKCEICNKCFPFPWSLKRHVKVRHSGEKPDKPNKCEFCGRTYTFPWGLKAHMLVHSGEKPFACDICAKRFTSKSSLKSHLKTHAAKTPLPLPGKVTLFS